MPSSDQPVTVTAEFVSDRIGISVTDWVVEWYVAARAGTRLACTARGCGIPSATIGSAPFSIPGEDQPHDTDPTTKPLEECVAGTAWSGAASAQEEKARQPGHRRHTFVSRRMDEMTSREIELYLNAGGDLVLIPFGPVSGHGALIPVGMHAHWAHALSVLIAEKANGLVFPLTHCCFAGATRTFRGTVSFTFAEQVTVLKRIASTLKKQGFRRTVLVGGTNPEDTGGMVAARSYSMRRRNRFGSSRHLGRSSCPKSRHSMMVIQGSSERLSSRWPA